MVNEGATVTLPDAPETPVRLLTPLSITMELAPVVIQLSVAVPPDVMLDGEILSVAVGDEPGSGGVEMLPTDIVVLA